MSTTLSILAIESWLLYALAISSIFLRVISRRVSLGSFSRFQSDDYIMLFITFTFSGSIICANQIVSNGDVSRSTGANMGMLNKNNFIWRRRMAFALEEFQLSTVWLVRACLVIMFMRIFHQTRERQLIMAVGIFCAVSYLLVQILFLGVWCRPISQYWALNSENAQCTSFTSHNLLTIPFITSTTLLTSILPIPFIPTPRKHLLHALLVLGSITLLFSILARVTYLRKPETYQHLYLYAVETSLAIITGNITFLFGLTSKTPRRGSGSSPYYRYHSSTLSAGSLLHSRSESHTRVPPTPAPTLAEEEPTSTPPSRAPSRAPSRQGLPSSKLSLLHPTPTPFASHSCFDISSPSPCTPTAPKPSSSTTTLPAGSIPKRSSSLKWPSAAWARSPCSVNTDSKLSLRLDPSHRGSKLGLPSPSSPRTNNRLWTSPTSRTPSSETIVAPTLTHTPLPLPNRSLSPASTLTFTLTSGSITARHQQPPNTVDDGWSDLGGPESGTVTPRVPVLGPLDAPLELNEWLQGKGTGRRGSRAVVFPSPPNSVSIFPLRHASLSSSLYSRDVNDEGKEGIECS